MLNKYSEFYQISKEVSKNDSGEPLVDSEIKLYNLDEIAKKENLTHYKTPDGIKIKGDNIFLIEFKGGEEILNNSDKQLEELLEEQEKIEKKYHILNNFKKRSGILDSLKLKLSETLLFVLPDILNLKVEEIFKNYNVFYIVVVSEEVDLGKSKNMERERNFYLSNWNRGINFDLKKYEKHPIKKIITENKNFYDKYISEKLR